MNARCRYALQFEWQPWPFAICVDALQCIRQHVWWVRERLSEGGLVLVSDNSSAGKSAAMCAAVARFGTHRHVTIVSAAHPYGQPSGTHAHPDFHDCNRHAHRPRSRQDHVRYRKEHS